MLTEIEIVNNALFYEENGKAQVNSKSGNHVSWYQEIHKDFLDNTIPYIAENEEHFIEYFPASFSFGESTSYKQGIGSERIYKHTYINYGVGYLYFTDKNLGIVFFDELTKKYPLYPTGFDGILSGFLDRMLGEKKHQNPWDGDADWVISYEEILGAQIAKVDEHGDKVVHIKTELNDWYVHEHFENSLQHILTIIKLGLSGKLVQIWNKQDQKETDIPSLLKKLGELRDAGVITDVEFVKKKQELLNQL